MAKNDSKSPTAPPQNGGSGTPIWEMQTEMGKYWFGFYSPDEDFGGVIVVSEDEIRDHMTRLDARNVIVRLYRGDVKNA